MRNKLGIVFMTLGAVLIFSALSLFYWNRWTDSRAGQAAQDVVAQLEIQVPVPRPTPEPQETAPEIPGSTLPEETVTEPTEPAPMTEVKINGYRYIGYIFFPDYDLKLPVMTDWDYKKLNIAPCRYVGSTATDDLVIMAHNFANHFGHLKNLVPGNTVEFTDMDGLVHTYQVVMVETLQPQAIEEMTAGEYDLTLFTCTYGGKSRVTVRCNRTE